MKRLSRWILPAVLLLGSVACGPPRKSMFPPTINVQELHVQPDGSWRMQVRILNNSYGSMDFQALHLAMTVDDHPAGMLDARIDLDIPALSADVTPYVLKPGTEAAAALAAIANKGSSGSVQYTFKGTATALPEREKKPRDFKVDSRDWMSAVPGIPDTYR